METQATLKLLFIKKPQLKIANQWTTYTEHPLFSPIKLKVSTIYFTGINQLEWTTEDNESHRFISLAFVLENLYLQLTLFTA